MYYRRKILLALIEAFGGRLKRIDCQKLLFLFCQYSKHNYYDFFPYKYGGFSFLIYQDKERLEDMELLSHSDDFQIKDTSSFCNQINMEDQLAIKSFSFRYGNLRGNALIRQAYLEFPQYACNSEILTQVLNPQEVAQVKLHWNKDTTPCLFTIGYEGITLDSYLNKLILNNIKVLVDVRKNPNSMKYGFGRIKLQSYITNAGMEYIHIPELGIPANLRQNLNTTEAYDLLFRYYEHDILPRQIKSLERIKSLLAEYKRIALTCFEADYRFCHRHKIAEHLKRNPGFTVGIKHL